MAWRHNYGHQEENHKLVTYRWWEITPFSANTYVWLFIGYIFIEQPTCYYKVNYTLMTWVPWRITSTLDISNHCHIWNNSNYLACIIDMLIMQTYVLWICMPFISAPLLQSMMHNSVFDTVHIMYSTILYYASKIYKGISLKYISNLIQISANCAPRGAH